MGKLVLSRKAGQSIVIGDEGKIVITIQSVQGGTVDVRIAAPTKVSVHRDEIYAKLHANNVPTAVAEGAAAAENARKPRMHYRRRRTA